MLRGRRTECAELGRLLEALPSGHSAILVLRGEAGYGKAALLEYLSERAAGCRLAQAAVRMQVEIAVCNGASRARTGDLLGAIQALSQLSYSPAVGEV